MPLAVAHHIQAWLSEAKARNLQASAKERRYSQGGGDFIGAQNRFRTESSIIVNDEILQVETGLGQQPQTSGRNFNSPAERYSDGSGYLRAQAVDPRPREEQDRQQDAE
jgi:hypothetical protein